MAPKYFLLVKMDPTALNKDIFNQMNTSPI